MKRPGDKVRLVESPLRRTPAVCINVGIVLLACCPLARLKGWPAAILPLGLSALVMFAGAAILIAASRDQPSAAADVPEPDQERVFDAIVR